MVSKNGDGCFVSAYRDLPTHKQRMAARRAEQRSRRPGQVFAFFGFAIPRAPKSHTVDIAPGITYHFTKGWRFKAADVTFEGLQKAGLA